MPKSQYQQGLISHALVKRAQKSHSELEGVTGQEKLSPPSGVLKAKEERASVARYSVFYSQHENETRTRMIKLPFLGYFCARHSLEGPYQDDSDATNG